MNDFFAMLARRALDLEPEVQALVPPRYAPGPELFERAGQKTWGDPYGSASWNDLDRVAANENAWGVDSAATLLPLADATTDTFDGAAVATSAVAWNQIQSPAPAADRLAPSATDLSPPSERRADVTSDAEFRWAQASAFSPTPASAAMSPTPAPSLPLTALPEEANWRESTSIEDREQATLEVPSSAGDRPVALVTAAQNSAPRGAAAPVPEPPSDYLIDERDKRADTARGAVRPHEDDRFFGGATTASSVRPRAGYREEASPLADRGDSSPENSASIDLAASEKSPLSQRTANIGETTSIESSAREIGARAVASTLTAEASARVSGRVIDSSQASAEPRFGESEASAESLVQANTLLPRAVHAGVIETPPSASWPTQSSEGLRRREQPEAIAATRTLAADLSDNRVQPEDSSLPWGLQSDVDTGSQGSESRDNPNSTFQSSQASPPAARPPTTAASTAGSITSDKVPGEGLESPDSGRARRGRSGAKKNRSDRKQARPGRVDQSATEKSSVEIARDPLSRGTASYPVPGPALPAAPEAHIPSPGQADHGDASQGIAAPLSPTRIDLAGPARDQDKNSTPTEDAANISDGINPPGGVNPSDGVKPPRANERPSDRYSSDTRHVDDATVASSPAARSPRGRPEDTDAARAEALDASLSSPAERLPSIDDPIRAIGESSPTRQSIYPDETWHPSPPSVTRDTPSLPPSNVSRPSPTREEIATARGDASTADGPWETGGGVERTNSSAMPDPTVNFDDSPVTSTIVSAQSQSPPAGIADSTAELPEHGLSWSAQNRAAAGNAPGIDVESRGRLGAQSPAGTSPAIRDRTDVIAAVEHHGHEVEAVPASVRSAATSSVMSSGAGEAAVVSERAVATSDDISRRHARAVEITGEFARGPTAMPDPTVNFDDSPVTSTIVPAQSQSPPAGIADSTAELPEHGLSWSTQNRAAAGIAPGIDVESRGRLGAQAPAGESHAIRDRTEVTAGVEHHGDEVEAVAGSVRSAATLSVMSSGAVEAAVVSERAVATSDDTSRRHARAVEITGESASGSAAIPSTPAGPRSPQRADLPASDRNGEWTREVEASPDGPGQTAGQDFTNPESFTQSRLPSGKIFDDSPIFADEVAVDPASQARRANRTETPPPGVPTGSKRQAGPTDEAEFARTKDPRNRDFATASGCVRNDLGRPAGEFRDPRAAVHDPADLVMPPHRVIVTPVTPESGAPASQARRMPARSLDASAASRTVGVIAPPSFSPRFESQFPRQSPSKDWHAGSWPEISNQNRADSDSGPSRSWDRDQTRAPRRPGPYATSAGSAHNQSAENRALEPVEFGSSVLLLNQGARSSPLVSEPGSASVAHRPEQNPTPASALISPDSTGGAEYQRADDPERDAVSRRGAEGIAGARGEVQQGRQRPPAVANVASADTIDHDARTGALSAQPVGSVGDPGRQVIAATRNYDSSDSARVYARGGGDDQRGWGSAAGLKLAASDRDADDPDADDPLGRFAVTAPPFELSKQSRFYSTEPPPEFFQPGRRRLADDISLTARSEPRPASIETSDESVSSWLPGPRNAAPRSGVDSSGQETPNYLALPTNAVAAGTAHPATLTGGPAPLTIPPATGPISDPAREFQNLHRARLGSGKIAVSGATPATPGVIDNPEGLSSRPQEAALGNTREISVAAQLDPVKHDPTLRLGPDGSDAVARARTADAASEIVPAPGREMTRERRPDQDDAPVRIKIGSIRIEAAPFAPPRRKFSRPGPRLSFDEYSEGVRKRR